MTSKTRRTPSKRAARKRSSASRSRSRFGTAFFVVLAVTMASTLGFFGIVASVLAGS